MKKLILAVAMMAGVMLWGQAQGVMALGANDPVCTDTKIDEEIRKQAGCEVDQRTAGGVATGIINTVIAVVGILGVVSVVIGGVNYTMSQGEPGKIAKAKSAIIYGIVGVVLATLSFAIATFIINAVSDDASNNSGTNQNNNSTNNTNQDGTNTDNGSNALDPSTRIDPNDLRDLLNNASDSSNADAGDIMNQIQNGDSNSTNITPDDIINWRNANGDSTNGTVEGRQ